MSPGIRRATVVSAAGVGFVVLQAAGVSSTAHAAERTNTPTGANTLADAAGHQIGGGERTDRQDHAGSVPTLAAPAGGHAGDLTEVAEHQGNRSWANMAASMDDPSPADPNTAKPADTKPAAEAKQAETKPAETKAVEAKPAPAEAKPAAADSTPAAKPVANAQPAAPQAAPVAKAAPAAQPAAAPAGRTRKVAAAGDAGDGGVLSMGNADAATGTGNTGQGSLVWVGTESHDSVDSKPARKAAKHARGRSPIGDTLRATPAAPLAKTPAGASRKARAASSDLAQQVAATQVPAAPSATAQVAVQPAPANTSDDKAAAGGKHRKSKGGTIEGPAAGTQSASQDDERRQHDGRSAGAPPFGHDENSTLAAVFNGMKDRRRQLVELNPVTGKGDDAKPEPGDQDERVIATSVDPAEDHGSDADAQHSDHTPGLLGLGGAPGKGAPAGRGSLMNLVNGALGAAQGQGKKADEGKQTEAGNKSEAQKKAADKPTAPAAPELGKGGAPHQGDVEQKPAEGKKAPEGKKSTDPGLLGLGKGGLPLLGGDDHQGGLPLLGGEGKKGADQGLLGLTKNLPALPDVGAVKPGDLVGTVTKVLPKGLPLLGGDKNGGVPDLLGVVKNLPLVGGLLPHEKAGQHSQHPAHAQHPATAELGDSGEGVRDAEPRVGLETRVPVQRTPDSRYTGHELPETGANSNDAAEVALGLGLLMAGAALRRFARTEA